MPFAQRASKLATLKHFEQQVASLTLIVSQLHEEPDQDPVPALLVLAKLLIKLGAQILSPHPTRSNPNLLILILIARSLYRFDQRLEAYMMQLSVSKIS